MSLGVWVPARGPVRTFAFVNLLNTIGSGLYVAGSALFFTRGLGLPAHTVAWGLGAGLTTGLMASLLVGRLADRFPPLSVYSCLLGLQALAMASFPMVPNVWVFVAVAAVSGVADRSIAAVVGAVIHQLAGTRNRALVRAQLRSTTNVGIAVGAAIAAVALAVDTKVGYAMLIWGNALSFAIAAMLVRALRPMPSAEREPTPAAEECEVGSASATPWEVARSPKEPLKDLRYLGATATSGVLALQGPLLTFCLPIWVATRTQIPLWIVSVLLLVNTALVVLFQAPAAKSADSAHGARRAARIAGTALAACCLLLPVSRADASWVAVTSLIVWIIALTVGELTTSTAQFFVSFELAPAQAQGAYQSVFALGQGIARAVGPSALSLVVLGWGTAGCVVLAAVLFTAGLGLGASAVAPPRLLRSNDARYAA